MRRQNNAFLVLLVIFLISIAGLETVFLSLSRRNDNFYTFPSNFENKKVNDATERFLNRYALGYLGTLLAGAITSAEEKNIYEGEVVWIDTNPGMLGTINYERAIGINGNNGRSTLLFSIKDLSNTTITDLYGGNLFFNTLKKGDHLIITESVDLIYNPTIPARKITVIKQ